MFLLVCIRFLCAFEFVIAVSFSSSNLHYLIQTLSTCLIFFRCNSCSSSHHTYFPFFGVFTSTSLHMCEDNLINPLCSFKCGADWKLFGFVHFHIFRMYKNFQISLCRIQGPFNTSRILPLCDKCKEILVNTHGLNAKG